MFINIKKLFFIYFLIFLTTCEGNSNHANNNKYKPGDLIWQKTFTKIIGYPSSSIAQDHKNNLYVGSYDCSNDLLPAYDTNLYAIDSNGKGIWNYQTGGCYDSSPAISSNGTIYLITGGKGFYSFNIDGTKNWDYLCNQCGFGILLSSPAIGSNDETIYVGWTDSLSAFNKEGLEKWKWAFPISPKYSSSPAIDYLGRIYLSIFNTNDNNAYLFAIDENGSELWRYEINAYYLSSPSIGEDGTLYVNSYGSDLFAINSDGTKKWDLKISSESNSPLVLLTPSPVIDKSGTIYSGFLDFNFYAVNPDGTIKWEFKTDGGIVSSPVIGDDGIIYFGSLDSKIYAMNSDGTINWIFNSPDQDVIWSQPILSTEGILYVSYRLKNYQGLDKSNSGIFAIYTSSPGPAKSGWPMFGHDPRHTGNQATPIYP